MTFRFFFASLILISAFTPPSFSAEQVKGSVVLLHGLGRTSRSMNKAEAAFREAGYQTFNLGYPSRKKSIERLVEEDVAPHLSDWENAPKPVHFFTHSLGGILLRVLFEEGAPDFAGRVVMLSPPNHGTPLADKMKGWFVYRWYTGPAGGELESGRKGLPGRLKAFPLETGVIAGTRSINFVFSWMIPGPDDGKVPVDSMKLDGMKDFCEVKASHTWIMRNKEALAQALAFFQTGAFLSAEDLKRL